MKDNMVLNINGEEINQKRYKQNHCRVYSKPAGHIFFNLNLT